MSAFIVDTECMDRIVWHVLKNARFFCGVDTASEDADTRIGNMLYTLNTEAVNYRYRETEDAPAYEFRYRPSTPVQTYKSIRSFLYQCNQGEQFASSPAYRKLEGMNNRLAVQIIA